MNSRDLEKIIRQIQRHQGTLLSVLNLRGTKIGGIITLLITGLGIFITSQYGEHQSSTNAPINVAKGEKIACVLERVIDGDTVVADCNGVSNIRIRMAKIDAPETGQKPLGEMSKEFLEKILPKHFTLHYEGKDFYQRSLGVLYDNQQNINLRMVQDGYAFAYEAKNTPKIYKEAQVMAQNHHAGLWGKYPSKMKSPKEWRKYNK